PARSSRFRAGFQSTGAPLRLFRVPGVLHHLAAGLIAFVAFLGAHLHVLIVGELFALLAAQSAGNAARFADERGEGTTARDDLSSGRADVGTVLAGGQRRHVLLFAVEQQMRAVVGARVARSLAIGTGLCA